MKNAGWAFIAAVMLAVQVIMLCLLLERKEKLSKISEIEEQTAIFNNEAAAHNLQSEKLRRQYYETLVNVGLFNKSFLDYTIPGSDENGK